MTFGGGAEIVQMAYCGKLLFICDLDCSAGTDLRAVRSKGY